MKREMKLDKAKAVWLLKIGSRGVGFQERIDLFEEDNLLYEAHRALANNRCFVYDIATQTIKLNRN
jgi:hypothetical protein